VANGSQPAMTPEQWDAKDYRQPAHELDRWADAQPGAAGDDRTEYVAKLGLTETGSVVAMNRAHDRVLIPPPARSVLAALALAGQPFGFTTADVRAARSAAERAPDHRAKSELERLAARLEALLPPSGA